MTYEALYDEPITKRVMIELLLIEVQDEDKIDAALRALMPGDINDAEYRHELIEMIRDAWNERLQRRYPGDCNPTEQDFEQMFDDVQALVGVPFKKEKPRRPRKKTSNTASVIPLNPQDGNGGIIRSPQRAIVLPDRQHF